MEVTKKPTPDCPNLNFDCFNESFIFLTGNKLCRKPFHGGQMSFFTLSKHIDILYDFKVAYNLSGVFVAYKHEGQVEICYYSFTGKQQILNLSKDLFASTQIYQLKLLVDSGRTTLLYGVAKTQQNVCVFIVDYQMKIRGVTYIPFFEDIKVDPFDLHTLSVCGITNHQAYITKLCYIDGEWEVYEQIYEQVESRVIQHQLLDQEVTIIVTKDKIYLYQDSALLQHQPLSSSNKTILQVLKLQRGVLIRFSDDSLKLMLSDDPYLDDQELKIQLQPQETICKMVYVRSFADSYQSVVIRTTQNLYCWRHHHGSGDQTFYLIDSNFNIECQENLDRQLNQHRNLFLNLRQSHSKQKSKYLEVLLTIEQNLAKRGQNKDQTKEQIKAMEILEQKKKLVLSFLQFEQQNQMSLCKLQKRNEKLIAYLKANSIKLQQKNVNYCKSISNLGIELNKAKEEVKSKQIQRDSLSWMMKYIEKRSAQLLCDNHSKNSLIEEKNQIIKWQQYKLRLLQDGQQQKGKVQVLSLEDFISNKSKQVSGAVGFPAINIFHSSQPVQNIFIKDTIANKSQLPNIKPPSTQTANHPDVLQANQPPIKTVIENDHEIVEIHHDDSHNSQESCAE